MIKSPLLPAETKIYLYAAAINAYPNRSRLGLLLAESHHHTSEEACPFHYQAACRTLIA